MKLYSVELYSSLWRDAGRGRRHDARDGVENTRPTDTDGRQSARERREVERKRRFVIIVIALKALCCS